VVQPDPFHSNTPNRVDTVAVEIGHAFRAGFAPLAMRLIADNTLHPAALSAALAKAHAGGLVAVIVSAAGGDTDQLVTDLTGWIRAEVAKGVAAL